MARDNGRLRRSIRNPNQDPINAPRVRKREVRWLHLQRRLRERYGENLTRHFLRMAEQEVSAGRFTRDEFRTSVLTITVDGRTYRVAWDYEWQRISSFYPREVADV